MPRQNRRRMYGSPRFFFIVFFIAAAALVLGAAVMLLWNSILPDVLHVNPLSYWQAVGLVVLCKILFGNFRPGSRGGGHPFSAPPGRWREKWRNMSDEDKAKFKEEWRKRCERRKN